MDDEDEIKRLIGDHFECMVWGAHQAPDWEKFRSDFLAGALLIGAARPVKTRSVDGFVERMERVARANLDSFEEHTQGMQVLRFGNVAVVLAMSELLENGTKRGFDVSGYLVVKNEDRWSIAAHAWDSAADEDLVPAALRS